MAQRPSGLSSSSAGPANPSPVTSPSSQHQSGSQHMPQQAQQEQEQGATHDPPRSELLPNQAAQSGQQPQAVATQDNPQPSQQQQQLLPEQSGQVRQARCSFPSAVQATTA